MTHSYNIVPNLAAGYLGGSEGHYNQHEGNGHNNVNGTTVQPSNPTSPVDLWVNEGPGYGLNGTYNAFASVSFVSFAAD